jgi:hypothetical protein
MIIKAITSKLPSELQRYAFTQDKNGKMDISEGKCYLVYAVGFIQSGTRYFVHTDKENIESLWWMPAQFYYIVDETHPKGWKTNKINGQTFIAYPSLANWKISEGIIDGEFAAIASYQAEVDADPTFPTQKQLATLNADFYTKQLQKEYEEKLKIAKEHGWERPTKP